MQISSAYFLTMRSPDPLPLKDQGEFKLDLVMKALRRRGRVQLRVWGVSMLPSLWPGDLLTLQTATPEDVIPGDIGLVVRNKRCFIHRVVAKQIGEDSISFVTRGDAMPDNDPIAAAEFLGLVTAVRRADRTFVPARRLSLARSVVGWILCRSYHLRFLSLRLHAMWLYGWNHLVRPRRLGPLEIAPPAPRNSMVRQP